MSKSNRKRRPGKPRPDFPLFPHATNRWAKKIRGKLHYFGKVLPDDPKGEQALQRWIDQKDELLAGRIPSAKLDALTVETLANLFLTAKKSRVASGELRERTWNDYQKLLVLVCDTLGRNRAAADIGPEDWTTLRTIFAKRWGPWRLANAVVYTRSVWKWGWENGLLVAPMRFGSGFARPNARTMRARKNAAGDRTFQPAEVHAILDVASPNTKAALLLGLNCGYGTGDIANLPMNAVDLDRGFVELPRSKTAIRRRCPLWPQTIAAIKATIASRPTPRPNCEHLVFLRRGPKSNGSSYRDKQAAQHVAAEFARTCKAAGVTGKTFYDARRTFQTIAETCKDFPAVAAIMGHAPRSGDMAATYRQGIDDNRLQAVVNAVHHWLFNTTAAGAGDGQEVNAADPLGQAIAAARVAIAAATGPTRRTLESVWASEIENALKHPRGSAADRLLEVWYQRPDDPVAAATTPGERPKLRLVGA